MINYELHLTTEEPASHPSVIELASKNFMKRFGLDLGNSYQCMLSRTFKAPSDADAMYFIQRYIADARELGLKILRVKLECEPHAGCKPSREESRYFEAHLKCKDTSADSRERAEQVGHVSKRMDKSNGTFMVTLRDYDTMCHKEFATKAKEASRRLMKLGISVYDRVVTEFAFYDSNVHLDDLWLSQRKTI